MPFDAEPSPGALMPRASIHELVAYKAQAAAAFGRAWDALEEAYRLAALAGPSGAAEWPYVAGGSPYSRTGSTTWKTRAEYDAWVAGQLDRKVWRHVIKATNLDQLMDKQEREAFQAALESDPPPATAENIAATVERLIGDADMIFKRGIANAFAKLDRRFRSHDGFKIGARVVLNRAFCDYGSWNHYQRHDDTLVDVERTFHQLDGKPQPERYGGIVGVIDGARREASRGVKLQAFEVEDAYFRVRVFGNGNAHLWFKRKDLVGRVNQLLADYYGAALGAGSDVADKKHAPSGAVAKNMGWFPTPAAVAERVLDEAGVFSPKTHSGDYPALRVLEPSAGTGAIGERAARRGHKVTCVELHPARAAELKAAGIYNRVAVADFLAMTPAELGTFDRIAMNPPFDRGLDVDHVTHALQFLAPGGRLCAVMSAGVEFREDARTTAFRAMVERHGGRFYDLPPGSFAESGTNVNTVLCVIGKR